MKLPIIIVFLSIISLTVHAQSEVGTQHKHISVLSTYKEVFYFKVDADFLGAKVAVTDSTGTVFFTSELHTKRNLIDLYYLENGKYTIHFENNGTIEDYQVLLDKKEAQGQALLTSFVPHS